MKGGKLSFIMGFLKPRLPLLAMLSGTITPLLLCGCIAYVAEFNEAAYTLPAKTLPLESKVISKLHNAPELLAIHYDRYQNAEVFNSSPIYSADLDRLLTELEAKAVNPLPAVKDRILPVIRNIFDIHIVRVIEEPRFGRTTVNPHAYYWSVHKTTRNTEDELNQLQRTYREGMAIDFYTHKWWLIPYPEDETHYRFVYSVEARLIQIEGSTVFWKGVCNVVEEHPFAQRLTLAGLMSDPLALKDRAARMAEECTTNLISQLSEKRN